MFAFSSLLVHRGMRAWDVWPLKCATSWRFSLFSVSKCMFQWLRFLELTSPATKPQLTSISPACRPCEICVVFSTLWTCALLVSLLINSSSWTDPHVEIKIVTGAWSNVKKGTVVNFSWGPGDDFTCPMTADNGVWCRCEFCDFSAFLGTISDSERLICADNDVAVSDCTDGEIMATVFDATKVYPCSYEYANAIAVAAALHSLHWCSTSINAVEVEGAEFVYLKSFNDIEDDWNPTTIKKQVKFTDYLHMK